MTQSSYLMSFIHGLLENSSKEVRERKRRLLERDYSETEEILNVYLKEKYNEVTQILMVYRDVSDNLEKNRKAVQKMKRDINQCKSLLSFNREELRRLWLELVEQRRSLELIEVVERVKAAPEILKNLIVAKAWPEATEYLLRTTEIMAKEVDHVPALDAVKSELAVKKKLLIDEMRSALFFLVFNQPIALVINDKNSRNSDAGIHCSYFLKPDIVGNLSELSSSDGVAGLNDLPLSDWRSISVDQPKIDSSLFRDPLTVVENLIAKRLGGGAIASSKEMKNRLIHHSYGGANRTGELMDRLITDKKKWAETIVALTHCLHRLQKLSQAFYSWLVRTHINDAGSELQGIPASRSVRSKEIFALGIHNSITLPAIAEVERTLALQGETSPASNLADPTYLAELLQLLFPALCMHFNALMLVLNTTKKIKEQNPGVSFQVVDTISEQHIWRYIQTEVQTVLSAHLSTQKPLNESTLPPNGSCVPSSSVAAAAVSNFNANKLDLNILMGKRKGALPAFLSGVANESLGQSNAQHSVPTDASSIYNAEEPFFSFSKTAHSLNLNSYLRENRINMPFDLSLTDSIDVKRVNAEGNGAIQMETISRYPVVCRPSADNVKTIYSLVLAFARLIEMQPVASQNTLQGDFTAEKELDEVGTVTSEPRNSLLSSLRGSKTNVNSAFVAQGLKGAIFAIGAQKVLPKKLNVQCQLRVFLTNFIDRHYLPKAEVALRQPLVLAVSNQDALNVIIPQQTQRELGLQRPILSVAFLTIHALGETKGMAIALPDYAAKCAKIGLSLLETFLAWASSVYKGISVSGSRVSIPSAEWAIDKDLSRFWTNFPVWQRMVAADVFATVSTAHAVGNPNDPQLDNAVNSRKLIVFDGIHKPSISDSSLSSAASVVLGLSNLGFNGLSDPTFTGGLSPPAIPFANSVAQDKEILNDRVDGDRSNIGANSGKPSKHNILLHERETTRIAVKEMDNLLHIIRDEVGSGTDLCLPTAEMLTIKSMGRLRESVHWLERCVQNWLAWMEVSVFDLDTGPFTALAEEIASLSNATLLTVYLDVRVQAYNLLGNLPRTANFWCPVDEVDVDPEITRCLVYWEQLQEVLIHSFCPHEVRFIFDGLGDFISQIFLRLIPQLTRMNVNGNRKMCRNIYKLQQALALLTENHESDLIRVKQLYELLYLTPEAVVDRIIEQGVAFGVEVYQNLLKLYQRSHPSHDHSRTDDSITKLAQIIRMDVDEFRRKTIKLCLARKHFYKGTSLDQLYNRYLDFRSLLPLRPNCCSDFCLGCFRSTSHSDRIYRVRAFKQKRNKINTDQVRETFTCRFCRTRTITKATLSKAASQTSNPQSNITPASPMEFFNMASPFTLRPKMKKKDFMKETCVPKSGSKKQTRKNRPSLDDFLNSLS